MIEIVCVNGFIHNKNGTDKNQSSGLLVTVVIELQDFRRVLID